MARSYKFDEIPHLASMVALVKSALPSQAGQNVLGAGSRTEEGVSEANDCILQPACADEHHNLDITTVEMAVQTSVKALWRSHSHCTASWVVLQ